MTDAGILRLFAIGHRQFARKRAAPEREVDRAAQPFPSLVDFGSAGCEPVEETGQGFDSDLDVLSQIGGMDW